MLIPYTRHLGEGLLAAMFALYGLATAFGLAATRLGTDKAMRVISRLRGVVFIAAGIAVIALLLMALAFVTDDFSIAVVGQYSSTELPVFYKLSAVWAGSAGSLLLWSVLMFVLFALWQGNLKAGGVQKGPQTAAPAGNVRYIALAVGIGSAVCLGFAALLLFVARPFAPSLVRLDDGMGLNPLLRNLWMVIHPPLLFVGYSAFLIPFVGVTSCCFAGRENDFVIYRQLRWWLLLAICFLTFGIATGSRWSYIELGWGGYWAWDPVENVSLLPWLIGVAALHCLVGMRHSGRFRFWAIVLSPAPFILCLFATFVTRSGVIQSLHAFGQSVMSWALLVFIGACVLVWAAAVARAGKRIGMTWPIFGAPIMSVEGLLFWANLVLVGVAMIVGVATFWPLIRGIFSGTSSGAVVTREFYDRLTCAAAIVTVLLLGLSTLACVRGRRGFTLFALVPTILSLGTYGLVLKRLDVSILMGLVCSLCVFGFTAVVFRFVIYERLSRGVGGAVSHVGVLVLVAAVGLTTLERSAQTQLAKGARFTLTEYEFAYDSFRHENAGGVTKVGPEITIRHPDFQKTLWPHSSMYPPAENGSEARTTSEVGVHTRLVEDVYLSFDGLTDDNRVVITARIIPFALWLWVAFVVMVAGTALAVIEASRRHEPIEIGLDAAGR